MRMPFDGNYRVSQRFGSNEAAYRRFGGLQGHNGVDVATPAGTPLYAVRDGTWRRYTDPTGYGVNGVLTDAEGGEWLYGHLSRHVAGDGAWVEEGTPLAYADNTGNSTGNHLHFAHRPRGSDRANGYGGWVNPRPYLPLRYRVALQTGHAPDGGGAPGEAEWTPKLAAALGARLEAAGVDVVTVGGFYNKAAPHILGGDFDLFLALHYDARFPENYTTGCCIARGTYETEHWEADRFLSEWIARYPQATGIPLKQSRVGVNMLEYYAWRHLSYVTPGVLIEHGVGAPGVGGDAAKLWDGLDIVADADASAVLAYLGVGAGGSEGVTVDQGIVDELNRQMEELRATIAARDSELGALRAHVITPLQVEVEALKARLAAASGLPSRRVRGVRLEYDDGSVQEVAA